MFRRVLKKLNVLVGRSKSKNGLSQRQSGGMPISKSLTKNIKTLKDILGESNDVVIRQIQVNNSKVAVVYLEGMTGTDTINNAIMEPLLLEIREAGPQKQFGPAELLEKLKTNAVPIGEVKEVTNFDKLIFLFTTGFAAVLIDGNAKALMLNAKGWDKRSIQEPETEKVIRGPREGFIETLRTNTTLVRRRIRDPNLRVITTQIGRRSKTDVAILYIEGLTNPGLVDEVKKRLKTIDTDMILESGYIEQFIEDSWWSLFPTVQETERPDRVAAALADGRVAILVDNSSFALMVPATVNMFMTEEEDVYLRWWSGSFIRLLRFGANFAALLLPSLYIAVTSFHPEMIPTNLALSLAATRDKVPFPAYVEAFIMEFSIELLREAGVRLPGAISQTIGVVGAVVIGTAAVQASLVSPVLVIVVAFTAIAGFAVPTFSFSMAIRELNFVFMLLAAILGIYGIMIGLLFLLCHLAALKSFGTGYLEPFAPLRIKDLNNVMVRLPLPTFHTRPFTFRPLDIDRMDDERQNDLQREADSDKYRGTKK